MVTAMKANLVALKYPAARAASKADDPVSFHSLLKLRAPILTKFP